MLLFNLETQCITCSCNAQDSNNSSGDTNDQESDNSDNVLSSYGSENLSDDDGEELYIGKDFADWQ